MRAVLVTLLLYLLTKCDSHNWMIQPPPYMRKYKRTRSCQGEFCHTACQQRLRHATNSRERPARTYKRGELITVKYTRNNHHGGMMRIALVPVDKMWSTQWHTRMTIMHGCWEAGEYTCTSGDCGTDKRRIAYRRDVRIPDVFPDGDYVLGHVWYGGLHFRRDKGYFGDFFSCSHVRIRGGRPLSTGRHVPYFEPGKGEDVVNGKCETSADDVGQCGNRGCPERRSFWGVPKMFKNGRPSGFTMRDVAAGFNKPVNTRGARPPTKGRPGKRPTPRRKKPSRSKGKPNGGKICMGKICCPRFCGRCGGRRCQKRPGGGKNCCRSKIRRSGRRCGRVGPPCIQD